MAVSRLLRGLVATLLLAAAATAADPEGAVERLRYWYPLPPAQPAETVTSDVCVYGATPAGIAAAIQVRRMGRSATLLEFGRHVGGMTASGLSSTDGGGTAGGIAAEFYGVVGRRGFRPQAAEAQFRTMLDQAGVRLCCERRLTAVVKEGAALRTLVMENGERFTARMFVDATYEGDLLAMAGVSFTVGREANSQYGETINGVQVRDKHQFRFPVDPFVVPGDPASGLLPEISNAAPDAPGAPGSGDRHVQAYNFRMILGKMPDARPFPRPKGYDPARYEILLRHIRAGATAFSDFVQLHVGDSNNRGAFSTDHIGASDRWPEAGYEERERIFQDHVTYQQGLMWFLANDPRVPEAIRSAVAGHGLANDVFPETGGWPHQLYVREGRRMVADYVMTEHQCQSQVVAEDPVGLAEYAMDSHNCQRFVDRSGGAPRLRNEGDVQVRVPHPYPVSYRAIVPRERECPNLLVPVCLSATHIAYGSIRMEPVFMVLGQSAGTAACLAIEAGCSVQAVSYPKLAERLRADHQNLTASAKR